MLPSLLRRRIGAESAAVVGEGSPMGPTQRRTAGSTLSGRLEALGQEEGSRLSNGAEVVVVAGMEVAVVGVGSPVVGRIEYQQISRQCIDVLG